MIKIGSILALLLAIVALILWAQAPAQAREVCVTYSFPFIPPEEPQLFANQEPGFRTASEANGQTVPPNTYSVDVVYGDNNPWQMQPWEVVHVVAGGDTSSSTPDLPDDPNGQPGVWLWYEVNVGNITTTTPFTELDAVHSYYRLRTEPNSVSVALVELTYCYQETPTPTIPATATFEGTQTATIPATGTLPATVTATGTLPATETIPAITPTPTITPTAGVYTLFMPLGIKYPTPTNTPTPTPTHTPPPTPTSEPQEELACSRFDLEVAQQTTPSAGTFVMIEVGTGNTLMTWDAPANEDDSGERWFPISFDPTYYYVLWYPVGGGVINMIIVNHAHNSPYGALHRGGCHAAELQFP